MKPEVDTVVQFSGLKPGRYEYDFTLDSTFFDTFQNDEIREGNVDFKVVLQKYERMLLFTFSFNGTNCLVKDTLLALFFWRKKAPFWTFVQEYAPKGKICQQIFNLQ